MLRITLRCLLLVLAVASLVDAGVRTDHVQTKMMPRDMMHGQEGRIIPKLETHHNRNYRDVARQIAPTLDEYRLPDEGIDNELAPLAMTRVVLGDPDAVLQVRAKPRQKRSLRRRARAVFTTKFATGRQHYM